MSSNILPGTPVDNTPPGALRIQSLTASRDVAVVQQVIRERYGFLPSPDYCADLIVFIEELTDGQPKTPHR